jgi:hypothetical protein
VRVADDSGADSMLQFRLERGGNMMKCCRKMKQQQRAYLDFMGSKCDTTGGEAAPGMGKEGDDVSWPETNLTRPRNEENPSGRSSCYIWTVKT